MAVIFSFSALFTYTNILNNDNEVLPYKTIFEAKQENQAKQEKEVKQKTQVK